MKNTLSIAVIIAALVLCEAGSNASTDDQKRETPTMELGAFSISLAVKDLEASREFYAKLGFKTFGGNADHNWLILQNTTGHTIGLFQGMFEQNIMTFNPGWNGQAKDLKEFTDIREIQRHLKKAGVELTTEADESTTGPASITLADPDGNFILLDQHR